MVHHQNTTKLLHKKYTEKPREFQFPSLKLLSMTKLICKLFTIALPWRFFQGESSNRHVRKHNTLCYPWDHHTLLFTHGFNSQDLISNSPPYSSYDVGFENLVLDLLIIPLLIFFFFLITCLFDLVLIL